MKTLHLNCLPFICKRMQSSRANESVSDCSKTWLCIKLIVYGYCPEETHESKKEGKDQESIQSSPHLTQDTKWKVTTSQLDITNESQEVNPFQAGDHKASINRRTRKHNKNKTEQCHLNVTGVQFPLNCEISHSLGLQKFTSNQIRLNEIVVLDM